MAINKDKILARLNIDTSPATAKLKDLESQFKTFGQSLKQTIATVTKGGVTQRITTTFKELSNQISQIERKVEVFNKDTGKFELFSSTTSSTELQNQKKYFAMLQQWWKELSVEERNSIALLKDYSQRLGSLAAQTANSTTKGQILGVKSTVDSKLDTAIASSQKAIYGEINRLLQEQYSLQQQMSTAGINELAILQQRKNTVDAELITHQNLLANNQEIISNESYQKQLAQTQLKIAQQEAATLDKKTAELKEQLELNQQNLSVLQKQSNELKAQMLNAELNPEQKQVYSNTLTGKFLNSAIYFTSGMIQSAMFQAFSTALQSVATYENGIVNLRRTMQNVTENELTEMGETAIAYAKEFGLSIETVQDTMTELARAGINDVTTLKELAKTVSIGVNTTEISNADDMVGALVSTIKQLKLEWSDAMEIIDSWNYLADQYAVHTDDFADAIQKAGSASYNLGLSLYDVNAIVTILGEATQASGSQIGTALKAMEVRLLRPDTVATLESYGIAVKKNAEEYLSFEEIINNVSAKLEKLNENSIAYQNIIQAMGGSFRANWVSTLTANWDEFDALVAEQEGNQGYSVEENAKTMDTLTKKIEQAKAAYTEMFITMSNETGFTQFLKDSVDSLTSFATALKDSGIATFLMKMVEMIAVFKLSLIPLKLLNKAIGVDLIAGIKKVAKSGLNKIFKTQDLNLYDKAIKKVNDSLDKQGVSYEERLVMLKKIDKQLGTNAAGQLEYQHAEAETAKLNQPLQSKVDLLDQQIEAQIASNNASLDAKGITGELVNLDSQAIDTKLTDIGITGQQATAIKENIVARQQNNIQIQQNNASLQQTAVSTGVATTSIQSNTAAMITAKVAAIGLKIAMIALQTAISFGIGLAISAIFTGISNLINRSNDMRKAAVEAADGFNDQTDSLEETKNKIIEYNEVLSKSTTSLEDAADARKNLLEIQKELIDTYGEEAAAIDLLNGNMTQQQKAVVDLEKNESENYLRNNAEAIRKAQDYLMKDSSTSIPTYFWHSSVLNGGKEINSVIDKYYDANSEGYVVKGTYEERINQLQSIYDEIKKVAEEKGVSGTKDVTRTLEKIGNQISKMQNDEKYQQNLQIMDATGKARFISEQTDLYSKILDAQAEFDEAYKSGDTKRIDTALDALINYKNQALQAVKGDTAVEDYINDTLYSVYNTTIDAALQTRTDLQGVFGQDIYDEILKGYTSSTLSYLQDLLKNCGATSDNINSVMNSLGLNIENLSDDVLIMMNRIITSSASSEEGMSDLSTIVAYAQSYWNGLSDEAKACGITFDTVLYNAMKGVYNFNDTLQDSVDVFDTLMEKLDDAMDDYNNWVEQAKSIEDMDKLSREYYDAVRKIAAEYPELIAGIDETTGAYILQDNYLDYITEKQQEQLDNQNKEIEANLLSAIATAQVYAEMKKGTDAEADAIKALQEAQDKYDIWLKTKDTLYDSSALDAIEAASERIAELLENATKALETYDNAISLFGEIDTDTEKQTEANILAAEYAYILKQIVQFEEELANANENDKESIEEYLLGLQQKKVEIEDITKALVAQIVSQEKQNKLTELEIEQKNKLIELERQLYGEEGKDVYEERIEKQLKALSEADNADMVSQLADAYMNGDEARIEALRELLELQEDITKESEKQIELERLKLELENAKLQKTTQILRQDEQGNWQYEYTYDYDTIEDLQEQIAQAEKDYVNEQISNEKDNLADEYDKQTEIIETAYEDMKTQVELFYNDMDALVEEKFNNISDDIASALTTLTTSAINVEQMAIDLSRKLLESQLSTYVGVAPDGSLLSESQEMLSAFSSNYTASTMVGNLLSQLPEMKVIVPRFDSLLEQIQLLMANLNNNSGQTMEINIDKLEFPNITSPDGLEEAILELPTVATQYSGG